MDFQGQLEQPVKAQQLAALLATTTADSSCSLSLYFNKTTNDYFTVTGGVDSPVIINFANSSLKLQYNNPFAHSSVMLDIAENSQLRPEESKYLNTLVAAFNPDSQGIVGYERIALIGKTLDGQLHFEGQIPLGLPFPLNSTSTTCLLLQHLQRLNNPLKSNRSSTVRFFDREDRPYASVEFATTALQYSHGLPYQQPIQKSVIYDLQTYEVAGFECKIQGRPVQVTRDISAGDHSQIDQILISRIAELSEFSAKTQGSNPTITLAQLDDSSFNIALSKSYSEKIIIHLEKILTQIEPYLGLPLPENLAAFRLTNLASLAATVFFHKAIEANLIEGSELKGKPVSTRGLIQLIQQKILTTGDKTTHEHLNGLVGTIDHLKNIVFQAEPGILLRRYPELASALSNKGQSASLEVTNGALFNQALDALKAEELSHLMTISHCQSLQFRIFADGHVHVFDFSTTSNFRKISYSLDSGKEFGPDQDELFVHSRVSLLLGQEAQSHFDLSTILGFDLYSVWKCCDSDNYSSYHRVPLILIDSLGFKPAFVDENLQIIKSKHYPSDEVSLFNSMLIAGLKKMSEIGHVTVNWHSMANLQQLGELPDNYGPMSSETFKRIYPSGIITNNLLASAYKNVGEKHYPPEFYAIPFYLERLGYEFNESLKKWEK